MKHAVILLLLPMAIFAGEPVPWQDIARRGVQGELGKPLGHIIEVEAVVVSGRDLFPVLRDPVRHSSYFLRISKIAGRELSDSILIRYFSSSKRLPDSLGAFAKIKQEDLTAFSPADIKRLEEGIVGQRFRMLVIEEAVLKGNPTNLSALPKRADSDPLAYDEPVSFWQDYWGQFGYHHYVRVLEVLGKTDQPNKALEPTTSVRSPAAHEPRRP
jgi:hypothetical protein